MPRLGLRVQRLPDRVVTRIWPRSPGAGEDLVGPPAEQEGVGALVDLVDERTASLSNSGGAHPPRSNPPLRSSSGAPSPCITPSTVTIVVVVSFMIVVPFSLVWSSFGKTGPPHRTHRSSRPLREIAAEDEAHAHGPVGP